MQNRLIFFSFLIITFLTFSNFFVKNNNKLVPKITNSLKCIVVYHPQGCDYFICRDNDDDFYLLEWFGGNDPDKGDILFGKFQEYGFQEGYNITQKREFRVWVEEYSVSKDDAIEKYREQCN